MVIERASSNGSLIDVLDRVLDKGRVIDAWVRVSVVGIELVTVEARVVVASISTFFAHADALAEVSAPSPARCALRPAQN